MVTILSLPEELLIEAVSPFEQDRVRLRSLCLVSRRFHAIARKLLFRHVEIPFNQTHDPLFAEPISSVQARFLERSFAENDALCELVWTCGPVSLKRHFEGKRTMPYCTNLMDQKDNWEQTFHATSASVNRIESLPNLKELSIRCDDTTNELEASEYTELLFDSPRLSQLSAVKIEGGGVEMLSCIHLASLRELTIANFHLPWDDMPTRFWNKGTSLRKLEILGHEPCEIQLKHFKCFMAMCPHLEELKISGKLNVKFWGYPPPEYTFHIDGVIDVLATVRTSLKVLELVIPPQGIVQSDDSPLDLSQFDGLEHLRISGMYFLPFSGVQPSRNDLHRLLPKNLESLHIDFPPHAGFSRSFWDDREKNITYHPETDTVSLLTECYNWIYQFTTLTGRQFPNLRNLALLDDDYKGAPGPGRRAVRWNQPEEVRTAFANAGINVNVEILLWTNEWKKRRDT
jgi:hypothetical protein